MCLFYLLNKMVVIQFFPFNKSSARIQWVGYFDMCMSRYQVSVRLLLSNRPMQLCENVTLRVTFYAECHCKVEKIFINSKNIFFQS